MSSTLIKNLEYVVTVDAKEAVLRQHDVLVVDGLISKIGVNLADAADEIVDGQRRLLMPGLVNLHTHTPMTLLRGLAEHVDLQGFLKRIWAAEGAVMDPATVELGAQLGALESLLGGSTTQLDMYFHDDSAHRGAVKVGTRHVGGPVFFDFEGPDHLNWDQRLEILNAWPDTIAEIGGPFVPNTICPHSTYTLSEVRMREISEVLKTWKNPLLTTHISENAAENTDVIGRFGKTPTQLIADAGVLDGAYPVVFGHGVHLTASDIELAKRDFIAVAHCPASNMKLASGLLNWTALRTAGVRVGIGTDGCSTSNDLDMWQAMRFSALLASATAEAADQVTAFEVLRAATLGGAEALGMGNLIGSIEVGKQADFILLNLDAPHLTPVHDVHALLVYAAGRSDVCDVFVDGERVIANRTSTRVDANEVMRNARVRGAAAAVAANQA